jgi:hypothetical protein
MPFIISTNLSKLSIIYLRNVKIDFDSRKKNSNNLCLCFNFTEHLLAYVHFEVTTKTFIKMCTTKQMTFVGLKVSNVLFDLFSINFSKIF